MREGRMKLVKTATSAAPELYDLDSDVGEQNNLAEKEPAIGARLLQAHEKWNAQLIPPRFQSPQPGKKKASPKSPAKKKK